MKTKDEINKAIAILTIIAMKADGDNSKRARTIKADVDNSKRARKVASALCWVLDYPNDFGKFMEKVDQSDIMKELNLTTEKLDVLIKESIAAVKGREDEGHSE